MQVATKKYFFPATMSYCHVGSMLGEPRQETEATGMVLTRVSNTPAHLQNTGHSQLPEDS